MQELTLWNSAEAEMFDDSAVGRHLIASDDVPCTRLWYLVLCLCVGDAVKELTLDPALSDRCLQCSGTAETYFIEPSPEHLRQYLVYHLLTLAHQSTLANRLCWAVAQLLPGFVKVRIHVRHEHTTYHWEAAFHRRAVRFRRLQGVS